MERKAWMWVMIGVAVGMVMGAGGCGGEKGEGEKKKGEEVKRAIGQGEYETGKLLSTQFVDMGKIQLGDREAKVLVSEYQKVVVISVDTWQEREKREELKYPLRCRVLDAKGEELKLVEEGKRELPRGMEVVAGEEFPSPSWFLFLKEGRDLSGGTVEVKTEGAQSRLGYPRPAPVRGEN